MRSRALARLVLVSGAAAGALVFTVHLGHHSSADEAAAPDPASTARGSSVVAGPARSGVTGPAAPAAPAAAPGRSGDQDAQRALEQAAAASAAPSVNGGGVPVVDESQPHTHVVDPQTGGLVSVATMQGVVPAAEDLGPLHADPMPAGTSATDPTDTASLLEKAGVVEAALAASDEPVTLGATAPVGTPGIRTLSSHVVPSCSGTGTDGKRVQVLYVHEASTPSRYSAVLPILRNEVANVDDVFAVSAQQTGGDRRVRWVHDTDCLPVIKDVTVPDGALGSGFNTTVSALKTLGYTDKNRKYLAFADADKLCGIGTLYSDRKLTGNLNDGYAASYARVDTSCWSTGHSVAAHELTHNLGGVQQGAPHATVNGHCWDESDLMCYDDADAGQPPVAMQQVCPSSQEWLLDCNHDDYFSTAPKPGSFLATSWNTASSSFLDPGPAPTTPAPPVTPTPVDVTVSAASSTARTGDPVALTATSSRTVTWAWAATGGCAVTPGGSGTASLVCPSTGAGAVTVTATATETGTSATGSGTATVTVSRAAAPGVTITAPATATTDTAFQVSAAGTGAAPFTWRWTAGGCTVAAPTAASTSVTCPSAANVTVGVTGTQRDGQTASRTAAVVVSAPVVTPPPVDPSPSVPPTPAPATTSWSVPRVSSGTVAAALTSSGRALAFAPVRVQALSARGWEDVARTTTTWSGSAAVRSTWASRLRFVYDGDATHAASVSPEVRARVATRLSTSRAPHRAGAVLASVTGTRLTSAPVVLQRRGPGSARWSSVARTRTDRSGHAALRVGAPRGASYRWVFAGDTSWDPAVSAAFSVRP